VVAGVEVGAGGVGGASGVRRRLRRAGETECERTAARAPLCAGPAQRETSLLRHEPELGLLPRRVASGRGHERVGAEAEVLEDSAYDRTLDDGRYDAHAPIALGTSQGIEAE